MNQFNRDFENSIFNKISESIEHSKSIVNDIKNTKTCREHDDVNYINKTT